MTDQPRLRSIQVSVSDIGPAHDFYTQVFGWETRHRDGNRFAALDSGAASLMLLGPDDQLVGTSLTIGLRVEDLSIVVDMVTAGATLLRGPTATEHEDRAYVQTPDGVVWAVYSPR